MAAHLEVDRLSVRYGDRLALRDLTLAVAEGEVLAVVGPSGGGKSTLLRAVAGLEPPAAGAVRLGGRDLAGVAPHRRGIGLMFQQAVLFPHLDVGANVAYGLRRQGRRGAAVAAEVARLLEVVDLPGAAARSVATLSGGEQQRVALARALAPAPSVLLLDEPLGALDHALRDRLAGDLAELVGRLGLTVVLVTHDRDEAFALGDRVAVVVDGGLRRLGRPAELWADPGDATVAELLGLGTVVAAAVRAGRADWGWGAVAVDGGDGPVRLLVRPDGVRLGVPEGVTASVVAVAFRGARCEVDLRGPHGAALRAEVASAGAPARGATVRVALDPAGITRLPA